MKGIPYTTVVQVIENLAAQQMFKKHEATKHILSVLKGSPLQKTKRRRSVTSTPLPSTPKKSRREQLTFPFKERQ